MRIVIYGAGAVGGLIGAQLHTQGHEAVLIARGEHLTAMRRQGLRVRTPDGDRVVPVQTASHPREVEFGPQDVVLLCVKSQHTRAALEDLRAATSRDLPIVCCQNGVANERAAARMFQRVHGMLVMLPCAYLEPGVVVGYSSGCPGVLDLGRYPSGSDALCDDVSRLLSDSGFRSRASEHIMRWKYAKLLRNLNNALAACCDPAQDLEPLRRALRDEGTAALRAAGIEWTPSETFEERYSGAITFGSIPGHRRGGGSSWQSLERRCGNIETDYLNGEVTLLGRLHGVATPKNAALQRAAQHLALAGAAPGTLSPADL